MDGSVWEINPGDMPTVCTWIPTAEIEIIKEDDSIYPYKLINKEIDVEIRAYKIG